MSKSKDVYYLSVEEVLIIHFLAMDGFFVDYEEGTSKEQAGIKNTKDFLSAVNLPKQTFGGKDLYPTVLKKAATLMRSLIKNHPFHNGNKRTAVLATILFLEMNYLNVTAPETKMFRLAMSIVYTKPVISINRIVRTLDKYTKDEYISRGQRNHIKKFLNDLLKAVKLSR